MIDERYEQRRIVTEGDTEHVETTEIAARAGGIHHADEQVGGALAGGVVGGVAGAVIAGPVGAVVGGAIGAAAGATAGLADEMAKDDDVIVTMSVERS